MTLRAAIYIRVSTTKQDIEDQREACLRYAAAMGYEVGAVIEDGGKSGRKERDAHELLIRSAQAREVDCIIYSKISRAHRNTRAFVRDFWRLRDANVPFHYVQDGLHSDSPFAAAITTLMAELAEMESVRHGELVHQRAEGKRARAEATGERAKWGRGRLLTFEDYRYVMRAVPLDIPYRSLGKELGISAAAVHKLVHKPLKEWVEKMGAGS